MKELCQERGGEADQSGGGVKTLLTSSKQTVSEAGRRAQDRNSYRRAVINAMSQ